MLSPNQLPNLATHSSWLDGWVGPFAAGGAAVGALLFKLLSVGPTKKKVEIQAADSLFARAEKIIESLDTQVQRLNEQAERLTARLDSCAEENRRLRARRKV